MTHTVPDQEMGTCQRDQAHTLFVQTMGSEAPFLAASIFLQIFSGGDRN